MKKLPTFTIRDCKEADACPESVKFYHRIFGMDTPITVVDIINCNPHNMSIGYPEVFSDVMWVSGRWGFGLDLLEKEQKRHLENIYRSHLFQTGGTSTFGVGLADLFTIFLIENGYDVSVRKFIK